MKSFHVVAGVNVILAISIFAVPAVMAQQGGAARDPDAAQRADNASKLQQIQTNKAAFVAAIVQRWDSTARASGKWDANWEIGMQTALMKLEPSNLIAAAAATTYAGVLTVIATGKAGDVITPQRLGDTTQDLVYTPVSPCRIVDTRNAGGPISGGSSRNFDVDAPSAPWFTPQGGFNGSCNIPFAVARAVAMTITATAGTGTGYLSAYGLIVPPSLTSVVNYTANENIANTTIVPVIPGGGNDFTIFAATTVHVVIDVVGFFAAPEATPLDCTSVTSSTVSVPVNTWTPIDASCAAGYTSTGGGYDTSEGTLGYPGVWLTSVPLSNGWRTWVDNQASGPRSIFTYVRCCRVPGR